MKKFLSVFACLCLICSLAVTAFATSDINVFEDEYRAYFPEPVPEDYGGICYAYMDAHDAWVAGLHHYIEDREKAKSLIAEAEEPESETIKSTEGDSTNHAVSTNYADTPLDSSADDKYPAGSWVDPAGNVYSSSGDLLSPGTTPAMAPDAESVEKDLSLSSAAADSDITADTSAAGPLPLTDDSMQPVWYVEDLRPADTAADILTGLKSMVTSIFGEYTPITTTSVISETVGNETRQYYFRMKNSEIIYLIKAVLLAVVNSGNRKTWHLLLPAFRFGSNRLF